MYISHESKCVNLDNMDSIEVAFREIHHDYVIQIKARGVIQLIIYSSGHMTFEEAKFVYSTLLASINGVYYDTTKKRWVNRSDVISNAIGVDEKEIDACVKLYHEEFEKKDKDSQ